MPGRGDDGNRGPRRPPKRAPSPPRRAGGLNLRRLGGHDFELIHPRCVAEMELDYEEGIEIWKAGDPEGARDALRYALQGCGDNLWAHVALGRIALQDFHDPALARGHFGYAFELANRAIPADFNGRLPRDRVANRPFFDAIDGLASCYEALGKPHESAPLRELAARLGGSGGAPGRRNNAPRPGGGGRGNS